MVEDVDCSYVACCGDEVGSVFGYFGESLFGVVYLVYVSVFADCGDSAVCAD